MSYSHPKLNRHLLRLLAATLVVLTLSSPVMAEDASLSVENIDEPSEDTLHTRVGIGALTIIGLDLRLLMHEANSPWVFGLRYVDIKDDFINESAVGLPNDSSDKLYTQRIGAYADYLLSPDDNNSFYLSGGIFATSEKLECGTESDRESSASLYFGGGYQGRWRKGFGYQVGLLFSPFNETTLKTTYCESEGSGDIDVNASLIFGF